MVFLRQAFDKEFLGPANARADASRFFWEIKSRDIDRTVKFGCAPVIGSRAIHSISSLCHLDTELLLMRSLSCFCPICVDGGDEDDCSERQYVEPFTTVRLVPTERLAARFAQNERNFQTLAGVDGQSMAENIAQGDNFAVIASDPEGGEKFFIIQCDKPLFTCRQDFTDGWQNKWEAGDWLLRGHWYHRKKKNSKTFVLLDTSPEAYCYSHLILCAKFPMPITTHHCKGSISTYVLSSEVEEIILQSIVDRQIFEAPCG